MRNLQAVAAARESAERVSLSIATEPEQPARKRLPPSVRPAFPGCPLTASELDTLRQVARGLSYESAAQETRRSVSTVRSLLHNAYRRLGVATIAQALVTCTHAGWLDPVPAEGTVVQFADQRVTWAQRLYLEAFDQTLRAGDDSAEVQRTLSLRQAALTGVYREVGKEQPWRQAAADPIERIANAIARFGAWDEAA
jgi:DNA-binding CsgD family transcriptional regulator